MARSPQIEDPTKVTLYLPRTTVDRGKKFAQGLKTSLSKVVTELLDQKMDGTTRHQVDVPQDVEAKLQEIAEREKTTVDGVITSILQSKV